MGSFSKIKIDWAPFVTCEVEKKAPYPRSISTPEGLGDRLRFVAFAEKQAAHAFFYAAEIYATVDEGVKRIWRTIAVEEKKHLQWLLWRMEALSLPVDERPVSTALWRSFDHCETPQKFAEFMASSEEHGRLAGEKFYETLLKIDPITARIFQQIALEEQEHIRLAQAILDHDFKIPQDFKIQVEGLALDEFRTMR